MIHVDVHSYILKAPLCNFSYFVQRPEHIEIEYFSAVCPVKAFNECILSRFAWFNKFQPHCVNFGPLSQR